MPPPLSFMETMKSQWGEKLEETFKSKNTRWQDSVVFSRCSPHLFMKTCNSTMFNYLNDEKESSTT